MLSLQSKLRQIGTELARLTPNCVHYYRTPTAIPFLIWQEAGETDSFRADNGKAEQVITGTVDVFTRTEFDPLLDGVQDTLEGLCMRWALNSVQYEDDTNLIHYEWTFEVVTDGEANSGDGD